MFENIMKFFKKAKKKENSEKNTNLNSKDAAKERLHLVLMQDRANVSADFLDLMRKEIVEVIKKYIDIDEEEMDVRLTNKENEDGTQGAPALYANIPIINIKDETRKLGNSKTVEKKSDNKSDETKKDEVKDEKENKKETAVVEEKEEN